MCSRPITQRNMKENDIINDRVAAAMAMNRKGRRRMGKQAHIKIFGSNTAHLKAEAKPHGLTTFTGKNI